MILMTLLFNALHLCKSLFSGSLIAFKNFVVWLNQLGRGEGIIGLYSEDSIRKLKKKYRTEIAADCLHNIR